ncbi:MAG: hypothetical protein LBI82_10540 [Dysgonamonadaceae bacterium]|jgi:hypothetical protein|nr:hypothetical protein [Dysgonamonadaceae bacterium]
MEKIRNGIAISFTAMLPILSVPFYSYLTSKDIPQFLALFLLMLISILIACFSYFFLPNLLNRFYFIRRLFYPLARYEGQWINIIDIDNQVDDRVCGFSNFKYDKFENTYLYSGENFNSKGVLLTSFVINDIQYSKEINGFRFFGIVKKNDDTSFYCYGEIAFTETGDKKINSAHGFFINNSKIIVRAKFIVDRIEDSDISHFLGENNNLKRSNQRAIFAAKYYQKYKESINLQEV